MEKIDNTDVNRPGPWEPFHEIQLPLGEAEDSPEHSTAVAEYKRHVSKYLSDPFYEMDVNNSGSLRVRARDGREDLGKAHLSGIQVYARLHSLLGELGLGMPPEYQPLPTFAPSGVIKVDSRLTDERRGLARLFRRLVGTGAAAERSVAPTGRWLAQQEQDRIQFSRLQEWAEGHSRSGTLLPAVRQWAERRRARREDRRATALVIGYGRTCRVRLNGEELDVRIDRSGQATTLTFHRPSAGDMVLRIQGSPVASAVGDWMQVFRGLVLEPSAQGLQLRPDGGELACSPDLVEGLFVEWE
jgi:hypothetical protein